MPVARGQVKALILKRIQRAIHDFRMGFAPRKVRQLFGAGIALSLMCTLCLVFWLNLGILEHPYSHRLAVIIPFRDRFEELLEFVPHMSRFLTAQGIAYRFIVVNQGDRFRFNRGALINIGHLLSRTQCDYMVMHDVDLLPLNSKLNYRYPDEDDVIVHLAAPHLHPKYHYPTFVGGILLMRHTVFAQLNGLSNKYWGWGLEDDEFYVRAKEANVRLERPPLDIGTGINNTFRHIHDARRRARDMVRIGAQREESRKRDRVTGLNNVVFQHQGVHQLKINGIPVDVHNVHLHCDLTVTPWCEKPRPKKPVVSSATAENPPSRNLG